MEILLLILVLIFLFYISNTIKLRFDTIDKKFIALNKFIDQVKAEEKTAQFIPSTENKKPIIASDEEKQTISKPIIEEEISEEEKELFFTPLKNLSIPKEEEQTIITPIIEEFISEEHKEMFFTPLENLNISKAEKPEQKQKPHTPLAPEKSFWENFKDKNPDLEKFIGENLISKLGLLILVLGISYFVKYAIDKNWINEPARVGIGVLSGVLVMGIAHKLKQQYAAFSSVFVAGAIAIFYFTIAIAFHEYHLFNKTVAFIIMVAITGFSVFISYSYNRIELAVLSLIGGFAVPLMVSTGNGNYIVLFSYIIILNVGILALAYHKKWSLVNTLAFVFTILLYGGWLSAEINEPKPHYLGALLFGFVFYFIFILINIINNIKTIGVFTKIQLSLLTTNTFLFYTAGMVILSNYHPELRGLFTTFIALLNLTYAWFLYKKFGLDKKAVYLLIGLTLTFVTLAIPIQFNGHYITLFWAAEAVLLIWLAQKSEINSYRFASVIVHFLMLISLIMDWNKIYGGNSVLNIIINPIFITGLFAIASLFAIYYLLKNETKSYEQFGFAFNPESYRKFAFLTGIILSYFVGIIEVSYQANDYIQSPDSTISFPIVYHLLFFATLSYIIVKKKTQFGYDFATIIAVANIFLFTFWFSNYAFVEHEHYISTGIYQRFAFYLHYVSLLIIIYFAYQLYKMEKEKVIPEFFNTNISIWIAAFFVIFLASSEIMLHGLVITNSPVTLQDIKSSTMYADYKNDPKYLRILISDNCISETRTRIWKAAFPILWGFLAFIFLIIGIKKQNKTIRIIALSLLGLTVVKLFVYDISNVSETGKIIAFILLGVLILIISFVYQKLKILVIDDTKTEEHKEINKINENE
ncbi:DUF2339 domain-containing protein [Flavobacterium psychrophilum]|uniref:DUF2339 domain-containing protein n=1 Tax=Flavobacterium psychrophilum TaxID=96345 RepID=UPI00074456A1|nr:DUF2339 domain-containing protein [Flavobacterium psychrophilum]KUM17378.1 hypothetical protein ATB91_03260 [Flavobacterium psychrophilum]